MLAQHRIGARLLAQIHDEMLFEVPQVEINAAASVIKVAMEGIDLGPHLRRLPPMPVSMCCGKSWGAMTPIEPHGLSSAQASSAHSTVFMSDRTH